MPISNYLPSSRLYQSGVCTSTTRPNAPYEGQVIYETDTDNSLVWNGSAWVFLSTSETNGVGMVKVIPTAATNGTISADGDVTVGSAVSSVSVTCFSSLYDHYKIIYSGGASSTQNDLAMRLGSTNSGYYIAMMYKDWGSGAVLSQGGNFAQWSYVGCQDNPNHVAIDVFNPFNSAKTGFSGNYLGIGTGRVGGVINGFLNDTSSYTSFTILTSSGAASSTITGGVIRVYGYRN